MEFWSKPCTCSCFLWTKMKVEVQGFVWCTKWELSEAGLTCLSVICMFFSPLCNISSSYTPPQQQQMKQRDLHKWQTRKHPRTVTKERSNKSITLNKSQLRGTKAVKWVFCCCFLSIYFQLTAVVYYELSTRRHHIHCIGSCTPNSCSLLQDILAIKQESINMCTGSVFHDWSVETTAQSSSSPTRWCSHWSVGPSAG